MCKATTFDLEANDASLESPGPSPAPRRKPTFHLMSTKLEEGQAEEGQPLTPCARAPSPPAAVPGWKKWGALFIFALQSAGSVLLMRYSKLQHGPAYSNLAAVMFQELVKLGVSTLLYANECRGVGAMVSALRVDLRDNAVEWLQLAVPALLYTVQNVMLFVGAAHLEAAIAQVTYQVKIFFTAIFSVCLLGKRLSPNQWLSLLMLLVGVLCVQGLMDKLIPSLGSFSDPTAASRSGSGSAHGSSHGSHKRGGSNRKVLEPAYGRRLLEEVVGRQLSSAGPVAAQLPMLGIGAMLLAAVCSSFASVYFEKMLKGGRAPSLWLRNMQLAAYSALIAVASIFCTADPIARQQGLLHGFGGITWAVVLTQSLGGILVAVCIKFADNILRTFAQTVAVLFGAFGSYFLFDFQITTSFNVGMGFVGIAIVLYGHVAKTPEQSYRACVGFLCPTAGR